MNRNYRIAFALGLLMLLFGMSFALAAPQGTEPLSGTVTRRATPDVQTLDAQAGNVTQVNIDAYTVTTGWQGYYGNISNQIVLSDGNNNTFYNWSDATPTGEVYAARINNVAWATISCASAAEITAEDVELDLTGDTDSVANTFSQDTHAGFSTGTISFTANQCNSTNTLNETGFSSDFANVILHDGSEIVYATILEDDENGFDGGTYDFQLLVGENGSGGNSITTPYYFYVELA